jgi:hypothetical protein
MKRNLVTSFGLVLGLLIVCIPIFAHHGGSEYDSNHSKTLKGTVTAFYWENPHCQILLDVTDEKGKVVSWGIGTSPPSVLRRSGWTAQSLHPGDQITITFAPSKKGTPVGYVFGESSADDHKIVLPNGEVLHSARPSGVEK